MDARRLEPAPDIHAEAVAPKLSVASVSHRFGSGSGGVLTEILDFALDVRPGSFVSIMGQSGCGKSTLFNVLAGLLQPSSGAHNPRRRRHHRTRRHRGVQCFQKDLLLPWRTVLDNVIYGMEIQGVPKAEARARAVPFLDRYGLGGFAGSYPAMLSGGMRQRAALLPNPSVQQGGHSSRRALRRARRPDPPADAGLAPDPLARLRTDGSFHHA